MISFRIRSSDRPRIPPPSINMSNSWILFMIQKAHRVKESEDLVGYLNWIFQFLCEGHGSWRPLPRSESDELGEENWDLQRLSASERPSGRYRVLATW